MINRNIPNPQINAQNNNSLVFVFAQRQDQLIKKTGDYLLRVSSNSKEKPYVIVAMTPDGKLINSRYSIEELEKVLLTTEAGALLQYPIFPIKEERSLSHCLLFSKKGKLIDVASRGVFLQIWDDFDEVMFEMKQYQYPPVIIRRIAGPKSESNIVIRPSEKKQDRNDDNGFSAYYEIYYLNQNNEIIHFPFKTLTNDPQEINTQLCPYLINPKPEVNEALSQKRPKDKCGFAYVHQNKTLYPEEKESIQDADDIIIALQTPDDEAIRGDFNSLTKVPNGITSSVMRSILNRPKDNVLDNRRWVIVTGHGAENYPLSGVYSSPSRSYAPPSKSVFKHITCSPEELANIIIQCGYQAGDHVDLLLYVCYGGLGTDSFAKRLAKCLLNYGISSTIVASKKPVLRFTGSFGENEKKDECLRYRVDAKAIVVVKGVLENQKPNITEEVGVYPDGFCITAWGLGDPKDFIDIKKDSTSPSKKPESPLVISQHLGSQSLQPANSIAVQIDQDNQPTLNPESPLVISQHLGSQSLQPVSIIAAQIDQDSQPTLSPEPPPVISQHLGSQSLQPVSIIAARIDQNNQPTLHAAAHDGDISTIQRLLQIGADIGIRDIEGNTPLHVAAKNGRLEAVQFLLAYDANIYAINKNNETPLDMAIYDGILSLERHDEYEKITDLLRKKVEEQNKEIKLLAETLSTSKEYQLFFIERVESILQGKSRPFSAVCEKVYGKVVDLIIYQVANKLPNEKQEDFINLAKKLSKNYIAAKWIKGTFDPDIVGLAYKQIIKRDALNHMLDEYKKSVPPVFRKQFKKIAMNHILEKNGWEKDENKWGTEMENIVNLVMEKARLVQFLENECARIKNDFVFFINDKIKTQNKLSLMQRYINILKSSRSGCIDSIEKLDQIRNTLFNLSDFTRNRNRFFSIRSSSKKHAERTFKIQMRRA